jgi:hypothetical protein
MKLPYSEGSLFFVPLRKGGYARGVVARVSRRGKILLGYFFGPRVETSDSVMLDGLDPAVAVLRVRLGDLGLISGKWPIVGNLPYWDRTKWPMPDFVRREELSRKAWIVRRADTDPRQIDSEWPTDFASELPDDSLSGYGAVEIKLTKLLSA